MLAASSADESFETGNAVVFPSHPASAHAGQDPGARGGKSSFFCSSAFSRALGEEQDFLKISTRLGTSLDDLAHICGIASTNNRSLVAHGEKAKIQVTPGFTFDDATRQVG